MAMAHTPNAVERLARATFILLCKLLLVDVVCSFVGDWLLYFLVGRKMIKLGGGHEAASTNDTSGGIQVIVCGVSRSGTTSIRRAMDILGFPCFHFAHLFNPNTAKKFMRAASSGASDEWQDLLQDYQAIVGLPAACSYKELMKLYPNAKVILNVRDPHKWYNSFSQTILKTRQSLSIRVAQPCIERCLDLFLIKMILNNKVEDRETTITNYKRHVENVMQNVPPHKLFKFDLEDNEGWDALCSFLEVPIPNVPFPFINKKEHFKKDTLIGIGSTFKAVLVCYLALLTYATLYGWKWITNK